jgi:hypothetical protein
VVGTGVAGMAAGSHRSPLLLETAENCTDVNTLIGEPLRFHVLASLAIGADRRAQRGHRLMVQGDDLPLALSAFFRSSIGSLPQASERLLWSGPPSRPNGFGDKIGAIAAQGGITERIAPVDESTLLRIIEWVRLCPLRPRN